MGWKILTGDCLDVLRTMPDNSVDAVVTDPPYGLAFMGKRWDYDVPSVEAWAECLRVLKPGGHLLAFFGTRTYHRGVVRVEDAGFEIRDCIAWLYGQGFPKSLDVSKAIDKMHGAEREVVGSKLGLPGYSMTDGKGGLYGGGFGANGTGSGECAITAPATPEAARWSGWGTALKPAMEPIVVARKPLCGTVAENVLRWGTGAVNIDGCRVEPTGEPLTGGARDGSSASKVHPGWDRPWKHDAEACKDMAARNALAERRAETLGRWPANVVHDGSDEVVALFPEARPPGNIKPTRAFRAGQHVYSGAWGAMDFDLAKYNDGGGSAARFFYCAKASKGEREAGLREADTRRYGDGIGQGPNTACQRNHHPTVKPVALMAYLCRLVTPPGGVVLDPFTGSGSTGVACVREGLDFIGIEREAEYVRIAEARIGAASATLGAEVTR